MACGWLASLKVAQTRTAGSLCLRINRDAFTEPRVALFGCRTIRSFYRRLSMRGPALPTIWRILNAFFECRNALLATWLFFPAANLE